MGKLYESRNQQHAMRYYQQALERFAPDAPELAEVLKDRGWLYFLHQDWQNAEQDLQRALAVTTPAARLLRGAIYDAMANLYRKTGDPGRAVRHAELALALREEDGDLLGIAKSHGNLGLLYRTLGDYDHALAAYTEAMATYLKMGNQELVAVALLNIGAAYFLSGKTGEALQHYTRSLEICRALGLPLVEIKAHYNLVEAYAALGQLDAAVQHWQTGYRACRQHNFEDQEADFLELGKTLVLPTGARETAGGIVLPELTLRDELDAQEEAAVALAQREHKVTPQRLMEVAHISRATATRRLTGLVDKGYLRAEGKGRGVHYRAVERPGISASARSVSAAPHVAEQIAARLRPHDSVLRQSFAVAALGVAASPLSRLGRCPDRGALSGTARSAAFLRTRTSPRPHPGHGDRSCARGSRRSSMAHPNWRQFGGSGHNTRQRDALRP